MSQEHVTSATGAVIEAPERVAADITARCDAVASQ